MARRPDLRSGPARLVALAKTTIPPMHPAGLPFVGASLAVAAAGRTEPLAAPRRSAGGRRKRRVLSSPAPRPTQPPRRGRRTRPTG